MNSFSTPYLRKLLFFILFISAGYTSRANHIVGMDMYYTWISGNTYKITLIAYGNCGSGGPGTSFESLPTNNPQVYVYNGSSLVTTLNLTIQPPAAGVEITPVCPAEITHTQCTDISFITPGIKKFVYSATYTLPGTSAVWRFLFTGAMTNPLSFIAGRALSITNISSTPLTDIQLCDTLNNTTSHNSSPNMTNVPTPFFCLSNDDNYNPGAVDADGDSLRFALVSGMSGTASSTPGSPVTYISPFTPTNPLSVTTMTFDAATGQVAFFPDALQRSLVVYNIREYRGGVLVGTCQREMTFLVQACTNTPPTGVLSGASAGTIVDGTHFNVCQNVGAFTIHINPTEAVTSNNITVTSAGLPSGLTFTTTGNGTPTPHSTISWSTTGLTPGSYTFYVTYTDNNCPLSGTQTIAYTINVLPQPSISYTLLSAASCTNKAAISVVPGGGGSPWNIKVSNGTTPFDTIDTHTGVSSSFTDSLIPGTYTLTIFTAGAGCKATASVSIAAPVFTAPTATFTNPQYCGGSDGSIVLHGLPAGSTDTVKFKRNGVTQPAITITAASDGSITIPGLIGATYTNITVTYGRYCVSTPVGPIVLSNPTFTQRALSGINPSYCGVCDGSITVYGLHPGQLDTINYKKDGVPQTPIVQTIGLDSLVVVNGLCGGVYSAFVTKTAGVCVSNTLGPLTLTVPPFTMRALSFTNPPYCGICTGTITIYGLHPFMTDTITYLKDGIPQSYHAFIGADSMITISGLCAGAYSNFVAHAAGVCASNMLGPVTLTVPPFTMRALSHTNPPYCGICTGTITLYGLHPGQNDTITYLKDGVPQSYHALVGTDSTIIITGLCAGVYDNFVAHTAGVCSSNMLGPVTLAVPPFTMRALSFTNPDYCGICNGTITLYGLHPGNLDTITYTKDGIPQTPIVHLIGSDSTVVITGLCAGLYANFIAHTGGVCVSNTLGPANLTVPAFTMRAISFTNPDYCGICNGTITLYGLHPGNLDTITFRKDGVPQTPVVHLIGSDSTVVITGLCFGVYSEFVAHTGGVCISNTLGPVTLTVPAFTMRDIGYTNPTKCGFCDGVIKLYGLHPGQHDTISYKKDGIAQPAVIQTIGPDSIVTIASLCKGIYSEFTARTGGVCVSNILGPVTLVDPPIIPAYDYVVRENCKGDTITFSNASTPPADLTYVWNFGDALLSTATNPVHVYTLPGTYQVKLIITNTKCFDSITKAITLDNLVKAAFTETPDSFICTGKPVVFTNGSLGTKLEYLWSYGDGSTATTASNNHVYQHPGTYHVVMALSNYVPCRDTARSVITVDSISAISVTATDSALCGGHSVAFSGIFTQLGNTGMKWTFGDGSSIANVNPVIHAFTDPGSFFVRLDAYYRACPDTFATKTVYIFGYPQISLGADISICPGSNAIPLTDGFNAKNPDARWLWSTGERTSSINIVAPGEYWATVTIHGCHSSDTIKVTKDCYMDLPNAFTPNGDGVNDYFMPRPLLARGLTTFRMSIFNRWGQLIFETENTEGQGWDGKFNEKNQPEGVYVYIIDAAFRDGQVEHHQGNVTLLR